MTGSSWQTESGLLDHFEIHVEEAWFGKNEKFGDNLLFNLRGAAYQDGELVDEEHTLLYSTGDGWTAAKGGQEATHKAGKVAFNKSSNMGKLIDSLVALGDDVMAEIASRGEATEAATWVGLKLFIEREAYTFTDRKTGETRSYEVPLVTDFLGVVDDEEKPKAKAKTRTRRSKAADTEEATEDEAPKPRRRSRKKAEPDLRAAVVAFAAEFEDDDDGHSAFVDAVFDPDEFTQAEALQEDQELSDEALDIESDLWAEAHEE